MTSKILSIYFYEKLNNKTVNIEGCIYKFINEEYNLGFLSEYDEGTGFDNMKHCIRRHFKTNKNLGQK